MTSCRPAPEVCRLAWIEGAATLTTEASSTAMNCPVRTTASAAQGLRAACRAGRAGRATVRMSVMAPACLRRNASTKSLLILVLALPGNHAQTPAGWSHGNRDHRERAAPPRRTGRLPALPPGADHPRAGRAAAGPAPPDPRAAPRGGRAALRRRRDLVHLAGTGPPDQREHAGARCGGPYPAARSGRAGAP